LVAIGRIQNSRRDAGREISRHEHQENILVMIQKLHRSLKYERAQRELLERRIRSYENGWHIHDQALCDIREQLQEIRHLPADLDEALCSIVAGYRSARRRSQHQQQLHYHHPHHHRHQEREHQKEEHF
jgi:hypothetical protein